MSDLTRSVEQRVSIVEAEQRTHERDVEARLTRYETVTSVQTERIIDAVKGLAKLEAVPEAIRELRNEMKAEIKRVEEKVDSHAVAANVRMTLVEKQITEKAAHGAGQKQTWGAVMGIVNWFFEHGWKLVVSLWALIWGWTVVSTGRLPMMPAIAQQQPIARVYQPEQVVVMQPSAPQSYGEQAVVPVPMELRGSAE